MSELPTNILPAGTQAPEFNLPSTGDSPTSLSQFRERTTVLVFYPADFTPVCGDQLALYNEILPLFADYGVQILGVSVDDLESHIAFAAERNLSFPLLADDHPLGEMARAYGVFDNHSQTCERALFVIDGEGIIQWSYLSPSGVNPGANGILDALDAMKVTSNE